jgi:hypothetical protein
MRAALGTSLLFLSLSLVSTNWGAVALGASAGVPVNAPVRVRLPGDVDPGAISHDMVRLERMDNRQPVDGTLTIRGGDLLFTPRFLFRFIDAADYTRGVTWDGVRPNTRYRFTVASTEASPAGGPPGVPSQVVEFNTVDLDYGLYWFGADGTAEKFVAGVSSPLFDPARPTIVYTHGWQNGTSTSDMWRETPYLTAGRYFGFGNALKTWKDRGYNVAVFYWSQWADEDEVLDAQAKIWTGQNLRPAKDGGVANMRYRLRDGTYKPLTTLKGVADIFADIYGQAFGSTTGAGIRLVGHSLGAELAIVTAMRISERVAAGDLPVESMPSRLTLLDPFISKGPEGYLDGRRPGEICTDYVRGMIASRNLAVEMVKSSMLGGVVGDKLVEMREMSLLYRLVPSFIPTNDQKAQHIYSYIWYMDSLGRELPADNGVVLGAAASNDTVRRLMNGGKGAPVHYLASGGGKETPSALDDRFEVRPGVDPR